MTPGPRSAAPSQAELGRLRWRCRRGMRELDVLLERYVDEQFCAACDDDQAAFTRLLDTEDTIIYAYCLGQAAPPEHLKGVIQQITAKSPAGR
jgi:antitoxin CptB